MLWELLETCYQIYDRFSGFIKFWSSERNTKNTVLGQLPPRKIAPNPNPNTNPNHNPNPNQG